jgi:hypothetical protein
MHTYTHTCTHTHIHAHIHTYMHTYTHTCTHQDREKTLTVDALHKLRRSLIKSVNQDESLIMDKVCVCMHGYVCICMKLKHAYIYICMQTYTYLYEYEYACMEMHACMETYTYVYEGRSTHEGDKDAHGYTHACIHIYIHRTTSSLPHRK